MSLNKLKFKIEGMTCAACSGIIETETTKLSGVKKSEVNFATEEAIIETDSSFDLEMFHELLKKLGYRAIDSSLKKQNDNQSYLNRDFYNALFALILASIVMFYAMVIPNNTVQTIFTTILLIAFGSPYVKAVVKFHNNMNTLIGLGVLSSYFYSLYLIITEPHAHPYFEGGAFIIAFSLLGHYLDGLAKTKARNNLSSLFKMQVKFAGKLVDGKIENTPVVDIKAGDLLRVMPGEKIPLDGVVEVGETHTNESMITGESQAVAKTIGDKVFAGSLNLEGSFSLRVTKAIDETFISNIVNFVENAQLKKAPIQQYADRIVKIFVPIILIISVLSFAIWYLLTGNLEISLTHLITVLVIACPCALGLAVPMGIMLSTSEAAKDGLLISGGDIIEKGSHINTVVFDKTGTLTQGLPSLSSIVIFDSRFSENQLLEIAASCSQYSNHPLSQAIFKHAKNLNLKIQDPDQFKSLTGLGVEATLQDKKIYLGSFDLIKKFEIQDSLPDQFYKDHVGSYVFIAIDNKLCGVFVITDPIKPEAVSLIKNLHKEGINVWMLTGDHVGIAHKIGEELGILPQHIKAQVKPVDKASFVEELESFGFKVAMIGDGINDAPALAKAEISMAMSNGSDVALEASDVSLLEGKIDLVYDFIVRSRKTMRIIKENLILSSVYNILCIPLAAGIFSNSLGITLTPMWASLAMALSSFSVIINSFRVKKIN